MSTQNQITPSSVKITKGNNPIWKTLDDKGAVTSVKMVDMTDEHIQKAFYTIQNRITKAHKQMMEFERIQQNLINEASRRKLSIKDTYGDVVEDATETDIRLEKVKQSL